MREQQSKIDSWMEAIVNTAIGFVVAVMANALILPIVFGIEVGIGENLTCALAFTAVSILRQYSLRRVFNGRSVWGAIKCRFSF